MKCQIHLTFKHNNMKNLIIVFSLAFSIPCFSQDLRNRCGDVFKRSKYPADSFIIRTRNYPLGNTTIILTFVRPKYLQDDPNFFQTWLEQRENGKLLKSISLIEYSSESGIQLPIKQPLQDFFIINDASEFTGTFYLLHKTGVWYKVPGLWMKINKAKTQLFTYVPGECGGCPIGKFDVALSKLTTKLWDGMGTAWKEADEKLELFDPFKDGEWLQWKNIK